MGTENPRSLFRNARRLISPLLIDVLNRESLERQGRLQTPANSAEAGPAITKHAEKYLLTAPVRFVCLYTPPVS